MRAPICPAQWLSRTPVGSGRSVHNLSKIGKNQSLFMPSVTKTHPTTRLNNLSKLTVLLTGIVGTYVYLSDTRAGAHSWLAVPLLKALSDDDPEKAHKLAIKILKLIGQTGLIKDRAEDADLLSFELWGHKFSNPIGVAAGFDKDGDAIDGLFDIGFGYVEIGSVTPEAQPGNPKPRVFRIPAINSVINRYGFNSEGHFAVLSKLRQRILSYLNEHRYLGYSHLLSKYDNLNPVQVAHADAGFTRLVIPDQLSDLSLDHELGQSAERTDVPKSLRPGRVLAVNLGKNKTSAPDSVDDFKAGVERFGPLADVLVLNVSSPNTPGLRNLQSKYILEELLKEVVQTRDNLKSLGVSKPPPVLVKVAPDLSIEELIDIGEVARSTRIDGIIVSNTTISRPSDSGVDPTLQEAGGLSGPPLKPLSLRALSTIYSVTEGQIPLIGCGGISTGQDVLDYGKAGASFVQLYTALTYQGIGLPRKLKDELAELLIQHEGGKNWTEIVGTSADQKISIQDLINREKAQNPPPTFEQRVNELKHQIQFVENRVKAYIERHQLTQKVVESVVILDQPVPTSTQLSSTGAPVSGFTSKTTERPSKQPTTRSEEKPAIAPAAFDSDKPRGILFEWKQKRHNEIESGDNRRVV